VQFLLNAASFAATVPNGFVDSPYVDLPSGATAMQFAPDGRLFVCEQTGKLRVIQNGNLLTKPFLTVPVDATGERGLLGVAFDPDFERNNFVYVYYTAKTPTIHNRVSRFTANGNVAVAGSEVVLLNLDTLSRATNHNGGAIHFDKDGKLLIAVGDNADGDRAQRLGNLFGKILRINRDGSIPTDNPFFSRTSGVNRSIWALGLRNPFTTAVPAQHWPLFHQRRRAAYIRGDQPGKGRRQLRLARCRRRVFQLRVYKSDLCLRSHRRRVRDHGWRFLRIRRSHLSRGLLR
jgi:glucose/arabinose dehydrogenase